MSGGILSKDPLYNDSIYDYNLNKDIFNYKDRKERRRICCLRFTCTMLFIGTNILSFYLGNKLYR